MKIYIVEDERDIAELLAGELGLWGYQVAVAEDFGQILEEFVRISPDLVLMDVVLPFFNGFHWCQKIREVSQVPIMFLSSRSEDIDMVSAMQFGADDYMVKPFHTQVVRAKIQALLRRTYDYTGDQDYREFGGVRLYAAEARLCRGDREVSLTRTELLILETLFRDGGRVSARDRIMDRCWQDDNFIDDNTLAVNMTRLRKKLAEIGLEDFIGTKKGIGYYLKHEET